MRSGVRALRRLHDDLERMGLRPCRLHDLRRTFISLAQDDVASPEVLRWITHTPAQADMVASTRAFGGTPSATRFRRFPCKFAIRLVTPPLPLSTA